jgi:hypothetical protein
MQFYCELDDVVHKQRKRHVMRKEHFTFLLNCISISPTICS